MGAEIKLLKPRIRVYSADGTYVLRDAKVIKMLKEAGRIAKLIKRKDGKVTRIQLLAESNEIAPKSHRTAETVQVLPNTFTHTSSLRAGY